MKKTVLIIVISASCLLFITVHANSVLQSHDTNAEQAKSAELALALVSQLRIDSPNATITIVIDGERFRVQSTPHLESPAKTLERRWFSDLQADLQDYAFKLKLVAGINAIRVVERVRVVIDQQLILVADLMSIKAFGVEPKRYCAHRC